MSPTHSTIAPIWRRLGAIAYDGIVVFALWMVVGYLVLAAFGIDNAQRLENDEVVFNPLYRITMFSAMMLSAYLFFAGFWTRSGQTIGMLAWKIRIQNPDGSAISWQQALIRFLSGGLSLLCGGIGHWWMLVHPERRTLPDILSGSLVLLIKRHATEDSNPPPR